MWDIYIYIYIYPDFCLEYYIYIYSIPDKSGKNGDGEVWKD